ncbi:hypothetical protein PSACC_00885, partial [Paramicrosporidium saccamoebae]
MMYPVVLLLLIQLAGALEFGQLFRRKSLDYTVEHDGASRIIINAYRYGVTLGVWSDVLSVTSISDMQIRLISKNDKAMKSVGDTEQVKVQPGDVLIMYNTDAIDPDKYKDATAENLMTMIENVPYGTDLFGVLIKDEVVKSAPNYGFIKPFFNDNSGARIELLQSTVKVLFNTEDSATLTLDGFGYLTRNSESESWKARGGVALIREGRIIEVTEIEFTDTRTLFKKGDCVIMLAKIMEHTSVYSQMREMARDWIEGGIDALREAKYSDLAFFVAEIGDAVEYLEGVTVIGEGSVENGSFRTIMGTSFWGFEGDTMSVRCKNSSVIHITKNEEIRDSNVSDEFKLTSDLVKLSHLQPHDIVVIMVPSSILPWSADVATVKKTLSGCTDSSELRNALERLNLSNRFNVMAAFASDSIRSSKSLAAEPKKLLQMTGHGKLVFENVEYTKEDSMIMIKSTKVEAKATIVLKDNKVSITQIGGAVALIVNNEGLKYGTTVAFKNVYRKLQLEPGQG